MSAIDGLPPLREVIRAHGLAAKKSLGQNFLLDIIDDIIQIFTRSNQPVKMFKMLDKCYLGKIFAGLIGLGPGIAIKSFTGFVDYFDHIPDNKFAMGILHIN